eukprot:2132866-Amphidinium_carterae.1
MEMHMAHCARFVGAFAVGVVALGTTFPTNVLAWTRESSTHQVETKAMVETLRFSSTRVKSRSTDSSL